MRIISPRHDYYDCIQASGQDLSIQYIRTPEKVILRNYYFPQIHFYAFTYIAGRISRRILSCESVIIGFCGKIYPAIIFKIKEEETVCFTIEDVDQFVIANLKKREREAYFDSRIKRSWTIDISRRTRYEEFFKECKRQESDHAALFEKKRCPVFVVKHFRRRKEIEVEYNALLAPYEFYRVVDPYQAFQEIMMWLSSQAIPEREMPIIPDEIKAESKGFNEWSFRRPPQKT